MLKKILLALVFLLFIGIGGGSYYLSHINDYQVDGSLQLSILEDEVKITRDKNGIPYVHAQNLADLIKGQGFVVGQDRIFQVELYRAIIEGKLSSLVGEVGFNSDVQMLVLGVYENAKRHAAQLDESSRQYLQWLADGYNAYLDLKADETPVEFSLLGFQPRQIAIHDLMAVQHYMGFTHSQNHEDEIMSLNLERALGKDKAASIFPLNINPDRKQAVMELWRAAIPDSLLSGLFSRPTTNPWVPTSMPAMGSNNWVVNGEKSETGLPIMVNDPHLDATILPGPWFPIGLFAPGIQAVGSTVPCLPGILVGRTKHLAFGVTNSYGDSQDLYIETPDPNKEDHYLEQGQSVPYRIQESIINIKDEAAEGGVRKHPLRLRYTQRGPLLSDHDFFGLDPEKPVSFRWALAETPSTTIGLDRLLMAQDIFELDSLIADIDVIFLNFVFADVKGNIGHRTSGQIPIRKGHQGALSKAPAAEDDWIGFIPKSEMPGQLNPIKNWVGTANHDVRPDSFPYYYSAHFAPNYRYKRISEMLTAKEKFSPEDQWQNILDVKNLHAQRFTPIFTQALEQDERTQDLAASLKEWNFQDNTESIGASIFHLIHEDLVRLILKDDLPEELFEPLLNMRYYWLQRVDDWIAKGESPWFDKQDTPEQESLNDLIVEAGLSSKERLTELLGADQQNWSWGALHKVVFVSPLRTSGTGRDWVGGGEHPANGSGETLNRGQYVMDRGPYESKWFSSMRMVADLSDNEKIRAVISGGNAARQFHPSLTSQIDAWVKGKPLYWWLDPAKAEAAAVHTLILKE